MFDKHEEVNNVSPISWWRVVEQDIIKRDDKRDMKVVKERGTGIKGIRNCCPHNLSQLAMEEEMGSVFRLGMTVRTHRTNWVEAQDVSGSSLFLNVGPEGT